MNFDEINLDVLWINYGYKPDVFTPKSDHLTRTVLTVF